MIDININKIILILIITLLTTKPSNIPKIIIKTQQIIKKIKIILSNIKDELIKTIKN